MAKTKKGDSIHGWVNFYKPVEMTSTQAVGYIKRIFNAQKVGHGGTLDPLAEGVLPIALGEATKAMQFSLDARKVYRFTIQFGQQTNTDDAEGEVVASSNSRPTQANVQAILPEFTGDIMQTPPAFSALKIQGQPAYTKARKGEEVKIQPRPITIEALNLIDFTGDTATLEAHASKGTYVRALARDIGIALGCFGHVIKLVRMQAGIFTAEHTVSQEMLDKAHDMGDLAQYLLPVHVVLDDIPDYVASGAEVRQVRAGKQLSRGHLPPGMRKMITQKGELVSLVEITEEGLVKILRNFNLTDAA